MYGHIANSPSTASKPRRSAANGWTPTRRRKACPPAPDAKRTAAERITMTSRALWARKGEDMELTDLPNIGPVLAENLRKIGVETPEA